jgi:hypothetical protein
VRNALILLAVVALVILAVGALNNGTSFTIDYVAGSVSSVSLFWVSAVIAGLVVVAGLAASWFALAAAGGARRKLEAELQTTYERLRKAEALAARPAPAAEEAPPNAAVAATMAQEAPTVVVAEAATVVAGEERTTAEDEAATAVAGEPGTPASSESETSEPGEATAVTMSGEAPAEDEVAGVAGEDVAADDAAPSAAEPAGDDAPQAPGA